MAFRKMDSNAAIADVLDYTKHLKTETDMGMWKSPEGVFFNITRIQTPEEVAMSNHMNEFYKNYRNILEEQKEDVKRDC
jgi:hypothetical protein